MNLSQQEWSAQALSSPEAIIIDVRTAEECEAGVVKGAMNLDIYNATGFMEEVSKMDKSKSFYLYCRSGARSGQACQILQSADIKNVFNLEGGMLEWEGELVELKG